MKTPFLSRAGLLLLGVLSVAAIKPVLAADAPAAAQNSAASKLSQKDLDTVLNSVDDYRMILKKAGCNVVSGKTAGGQQALSVSWENSDGKYSMDISLNKIGRETYLSMLSPLPVIDDLSKIPVMSIVRLLEAQNATQGWLFVLDTGTKRFYMSRLIPAKITGDLLMGELGSYEESVHATEQFWNPAEWKTAQPAAPAAQ